SPATITRFAARVFYTYVKLAPLIVTAGLPALFAAAVGIRAVRRLWYGLAGVALLGLAGAAAAHTRHGASWTYALPSVVGALAGAGVLAALRARLLEPGADPADPAADETG